MTARSFFFFCFCQCCLVLMSLSSRHLVYWSVASADLIPFIFFEKTADAPASREFLKPYLTPPTISLNHLPIFDWMLLFCSRRSHLRVACDSLILKLRQPSHFNMFDFDIASHCSSQPQPNSSFNMESYDFADGETVHLIIFDVFGTYSVCLNHH